MTTATIAAARDTVKRRFTPTWRYVFNLGPTLEHRRRPVALQPAAAAALSDLRRDGVAVSSLADLTGDPGLLGRLQDYAALLERERAEVLEERRARLDEGSFPGAKDFVVHLLGRHPVVEPDGLLAGVGLHPQLKGIADGYMGLRTSLADLNLWRTLPSPRPPRSSQLWHRDLSQDHHVLKLFVYLEDVGEGAGPFAYALGTHAGSGRKLRAPGTSDGVTSRSSDEQLATVVDPSRWRSCTGPAGTVVFADAIGYHRGGWATTTPRLVFHALFASRSSARDYQLRLVDGSDLRRWDRDFVLAR